MPLVRARHSWEDKLQGILKKQDLRFWAPFMWLKIDTSGGLLCTWWWYLSDL